MQGFAKPYSVLNARYYTREPNPTTLESQDAKGAQGTEVMIITPGPDREERTEKPEEVATHVATQQTADGGMFISLPFSSPRFAYIHFHFRHTEVGVIKR